MEHSIDERELNALTLPKLRILRMAAMRGVGVPLTPGELGDKDLGIAQATKYKYLLELVELGFLETKHGALDYKGRTVYWMTRSGIKLYLKIVAAVVPYTNPASLRSEERPAGAGKSRAPPPEPPKTLCDDMRSR